MVIRRWDQHDFRDMNDDDVEWNGLAYDACTCVCVHTCGGRLEVGIAIAIGIGREQQFLLLSPGPLRRPSVHPSGHVRFSFSTHAAIGRGREARRARAQGRAVIGPPAAKLLTFLYGFSDLTHTHTHTHDIQYRDRERLGSQQQSSTRRDFSSRLQFSFACCMKRRAAETQSADDYRRKRSLKLLLAKARRRLPPPLPMCEIRSCKKISVFAMDTVRRTDGRFASLFFNPTMSNPRRRPKSTFRKVESPVKSTR